MAFSTAVSSQPLSITINSGVITSCNTGTQNTVNGLYSDTFAGNCVGAWWTLQDPVGGAAASVGGSGLSISVPSGSAHDSYTSGDNAAVLTQPLTGNKDFTVTARFTSTPTTPYTGQGIQAIVDRYNMIRCEVGADGGAGLNGDAYYISGSASSQTFTNEASSSYTLGAAPFYVRLTRAGNNWTCGGSHDGTNFTTFASWTQALNINLVGITVDTADAGSGSPGFTGVVSSFTVDQSPTCSAGGTKTLSNGLYSDTFTATCLGPWWTFEDPLGGASYNPTTSGLTISVPSTTGGHDAFANGDQATLMTQPLLANADFNITASFSTTPSQTYQSQGLQAIVDSNNVIRCEVSYDGSGIGIDGIAFLIFGSGGVTSQTQYASTSYTAGAPYYVRLIRTGNAWSCGGSHDGVNFTQFAAWTLNLNVAKIGITANTGTFGGSAPAWTETVISFTVFTPVTEPAFGGTPGTFGPVTTSSTFLPENYSSGLTSTVPGSFSLGSGSVGTLVPVDSTHATYNAPTTIKPQHVSAGCMVQPNDSIFNTRIDSLPVSALSSQFTNTTTALGADAYPPSSGVAFNFGTDFVRNVIDNSVPTTAETFVYSTLYNGQAFQIPPTPNRREHGTYAHTEGTTFTDHHLISINHQTCGFFETYQDAMSSYTPNCPAGNCTATSGWKYLSTSYAMPQLATSHGGTSDAAGLPLTPLTLHSSEVLEAVRTGGSINHAFRMTASVAYIYLNGSVAIWPSTAANGGTDTHAPPIGTRFRLKSNINTTGLTGVTVTNPGGTPNHYTVNPTSATVTGCTTAPVLSITMASGQLTAVTVTSSGSGCTNPVLTINGGTCSPCATATPNVFSPYAQVILNAMKQYGLILADNGFNNQITVDADMTSDTNTYLALVQIQAAAYTMANMEAVDQTSFEITSSSTEVAPANASGAAAQIIFTPTSGSATTFPIALQATTIGTPFTHVGILAGEAAYTLPYWVNGDPSNAGATWAIGSCSAGSGNCGSITSAGAYTPPATVTPGTSLQATLVATSVTDTHQSAGVYLTLYPAGTLRVDSGAATAYTDTSSNVWLPEQWGQTVENMVYPFDDDTYDPNHLYTMGPAGANPNIKLYQTGIHGLGGPNGAGDLYFQPIIVPNGTYDVTFDFALTGQNNGPSTCWGSYNPSTQSVGPMSLITQGVIQAHNWDPGIITKNMCRTPASVHIPAIVSDRLLKMSIGTDSTAYNSAFLNAYSVAPYTAPAKWVIDTQQLAWTKPNTTLQLYIQDWGTGINDPVWTLTQGPGTLSQTGLYTPPTSLVVTDTARIKACSASQPTLCANGDIRVIGLRFPGFL